MTRQAFLLLALLMLATPAYAAGDFSSWLRQLEAEALQKGISRDTVDMALANVRPIPPCDRARPETTRRHDDLREIQKKCHNAGPH